MTNASETTYARNALATNPDAVYFPAGVKRTSLGFPHKASTRATLRKIRAEYPQYEDAAVKEIFFGTSSSTDTVVVFDTSRPARDGLTY